MGTNFYWQSQTIPTEQGERADYETSHIGKESGLENGGVSFLWAQEPASVLSKVASLLENEEQIIVDETGTQFTPRRFLQEVIAICPVWATDLIGVEFS